MFRYIVLIYEPRSPTQERFVGHLAAKLAARPGWTPAILRYGLQVWSADGHPDRLHANVLPAQAGVILGRIFERASSPENPTTPDHPRWDPVLASRILESHGDLLFTHCWGNYIAILDDARGHSVHVLKDPTGELPCIRLQQSDVTVLLSHVEDRHVLELLPWSVRSTYLREHVLGVHDARGTPFRDITSLLPGTRLTITRGTGVATCHTSFVWKPQAFTTHMQQFVQRQHAADALRATITGCTQALARGHSHLLLQLSGGLDSSIIAACLSQAPQAADLLCYTYFDPRACSDERPWARIVASHLRLRHQMHACDPRGACLASLEALHPTFEPVSTVGYLHAGALQRDLARAMSSTALFTGIGGDSVLGGDSLALALTDYLKSCGPGPRTLTLAAQTARITDLSIWDVLRRALRRWLLGSRMRDHRLNFCQTCSLVREDIHRAHIERATYPHPWFEKEHDVPWSTIRRLGSLLSFPQFYDASATADQPAAETISPLYAQPVVELCLRIPLYVHFDEGRERGLARRAFTALLPQETLQREWKDRAPGYFDELVRGNREYLRARLLDGVLVRDGLLDRRAVENALADTPWPTATLPGEILRHLDTEIWLQKWMC